MKTESFTLNDGFLELHPAKLIIVDRAKRRKFLERFRVVSGILYSILCIARGLKKNDNSWVVLGILLLLFWAIIIIISLKKGISETIESEINIEDISVVTFKNGRIGQPKVGEIKTRQNKIRKIFFSKAPVQARNLQDELNKMNIETSEI